jgi:hypothetical protein
MTIAHRGAGSHQLLLCLALLGSLAFGGCSATGASTSAGLSNPSAASTAASLAPTSAAAASGGSATSQTDTDWGRIWDSLPKDFPPIAGSTPDDAAAGPASAVLVVQGDVAKTVATSLQTQLESAGYTTSALGGPLEDGKYTLEMTGPSADCMLQVAATPTGGLTTVTILYGAACPHE